MGSSKLLSVLAPLALAVAVSQAANAVTCQAATCDVSVNNQVCLTYTNNTLITQCFQMDFFNSSTGCGPVTVVACPSPCTNPCGSTLQCTICAPIPQAACMTVVGDNIWLKATECVSGGSCQAATTCG